MKYNKVMPLNVISYLLDAHRYYKEECVRREDWKTCDEMYQELLKAYHVYAGLKKDYRKDRSVATKRVQPTRDGYTRKH